MPGLTANNGVGLCFTNNAGNPLLLTLKDHGTIIQKAWSVIGTAADIVTVIETEYGDYCDE